MAYNYSLNVNESQSLYYSFHVLVAPNCTKSTDHQKQEREEERKRERESKEHEKSKK